jgi:hypothetical protein
MEGKRSHLDDLMHSIFYIASQSRCDRIGKVGDPERFCGILRRVGKEPGKKNSLHTLTDSALYSPVDDPEVFVAFGFALIIVSYPTLAVE